MSVSLPLIVFFGLVAVAATTGGAFRPGDWYRQLDKPGWTPPDLLFPIAWTVLYIMMAVAAWLAYEAAGLGVGVGLWIVQLILNALWSYLFFGLKRMDLALIDVAALWLTILGTILAFWAVSPLAGALMLPYLAWVSFAGVLNWVLVQRNPRAASA